MLTFPSFSALYLNLQAMIEMQLRWQITLGWFNFSITPDQKLFYYNPCKLLQREQSPALHGATYMRPRNRFSSQRKTATPRFFFQISQHLAISTASVAPTVILCVIQKYEMQDWSRVNPAHRAKHPG